MLNKTLKKQSGSAIMIAIFVILVISLLGASLVSLQRDSAEGASYEVYAARAYLSAYSASEIALVKLFPLGATNVSAANCTGVTVTPTLPSSVGFHNCSANYSCNIKTASAGIATRYHIVSTAICENSQIVTRRQITVEAVGL